MSLYAPFSRPLYVMLKPVGARCNLACRYCYYTEKARLYKEEAQHLMSDDLLECFTREYIESQTMSEILFTWHGGEPLMRPLEFYRKALQLQQKYARGRSIDNCIQTNGTLFTDDWCRFLKENGWLVGVSIDGPRRFHDACRCDGRGEPSFERVMRGIEMLDKYGVEWNAMAVINSFNADYPLEFYDFFRQIGCKYIQFTPVVERIKRSPDGRVLAHVGDKGDCELTPFSVTPRQWGNFLCVLFDEWVKADVGNCFIQLFDATLANWVGEAPGICTLSPYCGHASVMEWNGDVYACDHFVFPEYKLGNVYTHTLVEMLYGERQQRFGRSKTDALPSSCRSCEYMCACYGECPKNRFVYTTPDGEGENYLCESYYRYFHHVAPYMDFMKAELLAGRSPSNVMQVVEQIKKRNPFYNR